jgi:hypothetical protein
MHQEAITCPRSFRVHSLAGASPRPGNHANGSICTSLLSSWVLRTRLTSLQPGMSTGPNRVVNRRDEPLPREQCNARNTHKMSPPLPPNKCRQDTNRQSCYDLADGRSRSVHALGSRASYHIAADIFHSLAGLKVESYHGDTTLLEN